MAATLEKKPMARVVFRRKIRDELQHRSAQERVRFAWRCALRSLPFLAHKGNVDFWGGKRQKHLMAVLYALDTSLAYCALKHSSANAANAADAAAYAVANTLSRRSLYVFQQQLLADIDTIDSSTVPVDLTFYGSTWSKFEAVLLAMDCQYWLTYIKGIFESGFQVNPEQLRRHCAVPKEQLAEGAAKVGHYLENMQSTGARQLNESRLIILGEKGAGKTSITRRVQDYDAVMPDKTESTPGVDTHCWLYEDYQIRIWDFAGHTVTHAAHRFFYQSAVCILLCMMAVPITLTF